MVSQNWLRSWLGAIRGSSITWTVVTKITDAIWQHYMYNWLINTLRPRQNGRHFPDDIFKCIFLNENVWISIKISLKFVPKGPIDNIPALVQIMAWRRPGDKPLSEPMMVRLPTHICVTRPQWVKKRPKWYVVIWTFFMVILFQIKINMSTLPIFPQHWD